MRTCLRGRRVAAALVITAFSLATLPVVAAAGTRQSSPSDTIAVVKSEVVPSNVEMAVAMSQVTDLSSSGTVLIGRDDEFADSLASGVLQDEAPLLLVPREGPIPEAVREEIVRLGPSRAILLGGSAALSPAVEAELASMGLATERRAGASRVETAIDVARRDAAGVDTVILARAGAAAGATDPTQGFADALAAGGMAARTGWPVLLTQTSVLTPATREYLVEAGIGQVEIMGGTAAISAAVEAELVGLGMVVERLAGDSRAGTAVEVAEKLGDGSAAEAGHVVLVQGQTADAWAGGFAAAAQAAVEDAPIVLAVGSSLPPATTAWLADGVAGGGSAFAVDPAEGPVLTCVVVPSICEEARVVLGLPPAGTGATAELVSLAVDGVAAGGDSGAVDATGATVAFVSEGHVVDDVPAGARHVYVARIADDGTAAYALVDVRPDGAPAEGSHDFDPLDVSADGRYVAFTSPDVGLDSGAAEGGFLGGGYLRDLVAGTTRLVTLGLDGQSASKPSNLTVSADGSAVAYRAQLPEGFGILHHDLATGTVSAVELPDGTPFADNSGVGTPALSADGGTIAFYTNVPLVDGDTNEGPDTYVFDVAEGVLERVSVASDGSEAASIGPNDDGRLGISADGQLVAFVSNASNLAPGDDDDFHGGDVFVHDRTDGTTRLVSARADGTAVDIAAAPAMSPDGAFVAFSSGGDLTGTGETRCGVYRVELATGAITRVDTAPLTGGNSCTSRLDVADTGTVVFDIGNPFTEADTNGRPDVHRSPSPPVGTAPNLLTNPGAEADSDRPATGPTDHGAPTGWTRPEASELTFHDYGDGGYPSAGTPGPLPAARGTRFFHGGAAATSTASQVVRLPPGATSYGLSAWLGGFEAQEDRAVVGLVFHDAAGQVVGEAELPAVTAVDRAGATALLRRSALGAVPAGAASATVTLTAIRVEGTANDGYLDAISLTAR